MALKSKRNDIMMLCNQLNMATLHDDITKTIHIRKHYRHSKWAGKQSECLEKQEDAIALVK